MRTKRWVGFFILLFLIPMSSVVAAGISWDMGKPEFQNNQRVFGSGSHTLDKGETLVGITLFAKRVNGGEGFKIKCDTNGGTMTWSKTINGLIAGNMYRCEAELASTKSGKGGTYYRYTNTSSGKAK